MSEETQRKTLANCKNSEFLKTAMKTRKLVYECYQQMDVKDIIEKFREKAKAAHKASEDAAEAVTNAAESGKEAAEKAREQAQIHESIVGLQLLPDVLYEIFERYPEQVIKLAAVCAFMSEDEAESIEPSELFDVILECATSKRVLDFFIRAEKLAINITGSIYPALMYLSLISGMMQKSTSEQESQNSTNDIAEKSPAGDTSENVQEQ